MHDFFGTANTLQMTECPGLRWITTEAAMEAAYRADQMVADALEE